jgi:hypothetical protein
MEDENMVEEVKTFLKEIIELEKNNGFAEINGVYAKRILAIIEFYENETVKNIQKLAEIEIKKDWIAS